MGRTVRGKWRLDDLVGVGGSAAVYAATHRNGKRGALKILRRDLSTDVALRDRFLREGYVANRVGHPGAVAMIDDDVDDDGSPFLVMELLEGATLDRAMRKRGRMPLREVLRIAENVLDVLEAAHSQGIVHGDIKPANVFLTDRGEVKLLDFGIARLSELPASLGEAIGTPAYMSPEQARGEAVDGRTDLWAVGALMFALITGHRPRQGADSREELVKAACDPMPKINDALAEPGVSSELAEVIDRALTFERDLRWRDATTMQQALRLALLLEQAARGAEQGLQVPLPLRAAIFPTSIDIVAARDIPRPSSGPVSSRGGSTIDFRERTTLDALPSARIPRSLGALEEVPPSSKYPSPSTQPTAFAATVRPPSSSARTRTSSRKFVSVAVLGVLLTVGIGLGTLFVSPVAVESQGSSLGASTKGQDGGIDATLQNTVHRVAAGDPGP